MDSSSNKSNNSPKYYVTQEEFLQALNSQLAEYGITAKHKTVQPQATSNSEKEY